MARDTDPVIIGDTHCSVTLYPPEAVRNHGLEHRMDVVAGPFRGSVTVDCYEKPYRRFHDHLSALHETLSGEARLGPSYENLEIVFSGDGKGHITVHVVVYPDSASRIRLEFRIFLDQTELPRILRQVEQAFIRDMPQIIETS